MCLEGIFGAIQKKNAPPPTPAQPIANATPDTTPKAVVKSNLDVGAVSTGNYKKSGKSKSVPGLGL